MLVDQRDSDGSFCQSARNFHTAEACADDHNMGESFGVHDFPLCFKNVPKVSLKALLV
jgi:hypothetical protein